ncbi:hypothetical protein OSB04_un000118 [Centaurea solstitialis]|uniref:Reverse transcriptase zinc-binding domain-containing protein n=1 Tax=Centaurea solstitialis TaxID=347529 RepID=A0AA38SDB5_9ASTR|nr:hypothetical protein OSB04_un000118 [Centaurea solstitialis]
MADYVFPDTESLEIPRIISERTSMHQPQLDADRQLLQAALFLEEKPNNVVYSVHAKTKAPVIAEILKSHPLFVPLTKEADVPLIYVQQAWKLLEFHETEDRCYYTTKIDHFTISFGLNKFRYLLGFPSATSRPGAVQFEPFDSVDEALASVRSIGYNAELHTTSGFNKTNLPPTYNTLFTILNRCLTGKKTAHDTATQSMLLFFQGVLFNRHYDYAALIFHDMHELKGRNPNHLAYPRFLSILIASAMEQNPDIPRRLNSVKVKHFSFQSVRYPPTVFGPEIPLFSELLAYADQGVKCVREYRAKYASMVQPEPAGPSQDAIHRSEGIVLRDQRSRDPGQGVQRENTERGLGGDLPDQPAHSSTANVVAHIGQISSAVQMDDVFAAADDEHAVNQPFVQLQDEDQLVDYELSPLDVHTLESFGDHEIESPHVLADEPVPLYTPVEMDQRLTILMGYESSGSVSSEETLILPSDSEAACDMDAQHEELQDSDDDDSDDDADMPDQGSSRLLTLGEIRTDEGVLVENPEVRMSEGEGEKDGESEIGARKEVQTPPQAESSWVATSTRGEHLLPSPIDQDMRTPLMQCTTQLNHSTVSQQTVVSTSHGDLSQLVPIPHLEVGGTDIVRQLPPPTTSFPITSSLEPLATNVNLSLARTPVQTTFAGGFSSPAGTTGVSSAFVAGLRGPEGNPISANIMPTLNMGSLGSTFGSTRSLSDLGVSLPVSPIITALRQQSTILGSSSTPVGSSSSASSSATQSSTVSASSASTTPSVSVPPPHGSSSSPDIDLSQIHVVATADQLITRSMFRANNQQMASVIKQQTARISDLEKQVALLAKGKAPMADPPAQSTQSATDSLSIPELKGLLFSKLLEAGSSEDSDLVSILQQQTALQQRAIQEQRSQSHLVTHTEFQQFQASLDASLTKTFTEINKMFTDGLSQLSDRIRGVEETCQAAARRPTRRHDDHDRHEGERKRRRLESEPSRAPTTSGVRIVDRFEERPPREKQPTRHRDAIVLTGGQEMEEEPVMQSTLDFLNSIQEEMPEERVEESGVKFSGASSSLSEIDRVLALLDNVASELRDYQVPNEEINDARCAEDIRLKDMFDDVEFDFEKEKPVDDVEGPSLEEVLPQDDLMPVDPKKVELWEKMKASSGKFLKRTEWDRFTRATGKYLEERYKSRFCYHERKLSYTKLYGIENLKKELRTEYIHMRRVNRQRREMLVSDHKFVSVTSYKTSKLSVYLYPVITFRRDDGKEYTITEADFQDMSFDVILGILYDLKGKSFRTEEEIIALTAIVRHVKVSISLAHLYDFQLGLENWTSKLFCHKPRRNLIGDEKDFVMYTVFYDAEETEISCVYPDSMGNKKRMYSHEVMLYCDDTLKMVMDNLNLRYYLPLRTGTFPIRYLGVPLSPVCLRITDFAPLVNRVKTRIQNWKAKFLSFAGRKQLIISVLQSMQLYWMAIYIIPSGVVHELEGLFRNFLWAQGEDAKGKCKLSWDVVCLPIQSGGLGIRRLNTWNRALVSKHIWDILTNRTSLWVSWIRRFRIHNGSFWTIRSRGNWPWIFRKILDLRDSIRMFFRFQVGNGESINAWADTWFSGGPLSMIISYRRFHNSGFGLETSVRDLITQCNGVWPDSWVQLDPDRFADPPPIIVHGVDDSVKWVQGDNLIDFTVRDAWKSFVGPNQVYAWTKYVWFKGHIPKHAFCMWTACHRRLPTQDRIGTWKHEPPDYRCVFCGNGQDSHDHLFFMCSYTREVWQRVKHEVGLHGFPELWSDILILLADNRGPRRKVQKLALVGSVYFIWMERNRRLFRDLSVAPIQLYKQIMEAVWTRLAWRKVVTKAR